MFIPLKQTLGLLTLGTGLLLGGSGGTVRAQTSVAAPGMFRLPGQIPGNIKTASLLGRVPSDQAMHLALALPLHDPDGLKDLIKHLYTPGDKLFGHYLTSAQSTARFGPSQADYAAVRAFAEAHGLTVTHTFSNRQLLDVAGSASAVEAAFGLHLQSYQGTDGRAFFAPDQDPLIPVSLQGKLSGVIGLDNANPPRPASFFRKAADKDADGIDSSLNGPVPGISPSLTPNIGTGIGGLSPSDIKTAYNLNGVPTNGTGQVLGLFEYDRYTASDITTYENQYGLPNVTVQNIGVNGYDTTAAPTGGAGEVTLDIDLQIAIAPGMTKLEVYEGNNTTDIYNQIASDDTASEVSTSWGGSEPSSTQGYISSENSIFRTMAAQGQSIYAAAGDGGADDNGSSLSVDDPASQPYMTGVGGTLLSINSDGSYASETAWNGGGGGVSSLWSIPYYQSGFISSASKGSTSMRNVPDVSLNSSDNARYSIYYSNPDQSPGHGTGWYAFFGTSAAAPLWAGFTAVVNQQRVTNGLPAVGFANPALYALAGGPDYDLAFHDISDGSTNGYYPAVTGYDDATGLGTFNGANLFSFLTGLYAEEGFGGTQIGTLSNPYADITNAANAAPGTATNLYIEGGDYNEQLTISKPLTLVNYGNGTVSIGS